jgi:hypothetical protein
MTQLGNLSREEDKWGGIKDELSPDRPSCSELLVPDSSEVCGMEMKTYLFYYRTFF